MILFHHTSEGSGQIQKVIWFNSSSSVHLAVARYIISMQELLIEHDDQLGVGFADDRASGSKCNILSQSRIEVHDSIANSEIADGARRQVWAAPVWEALLV